MNLEKVLSIGTALVAVAGIMVVVSNPGSSNVIRAFGTAFSDAVRAATGK